MLMAAFCTTSQLDGKMAKQQLVRAWLPADVRKCQLLTIQRSAAQSMENMEQTGALAAAGGASRGTVSVDASPKHSAFAEVCCGKGYNCRRSTLGRLFLGASVGPHSLSVQARGCRHSSLWPCCLPKNLVIVTIADDLKASS